MFRRVRASAPRVAARRNGYAGAHDWQAMVEQVATAGQTANDPRTDAERHVTINATLLYVLGGLTLFFGLVAFLATMFAAEFIDEWDPSGAGAYWTAFGGLIVLIFTLFAAVPAILAGVGLSRRQEWGRVLALVVAGLHGLWGLTLLVGNIFAILSLGYAIYAFVTLLRADVAALFRQSARGAGA
jgi:hypothetical protein